MDRFTPSRRSPPALPRRHLAPAFGQDARAHGPSAVEPARLERLERLERSIEVVRTAFNLTSTLTAAQIYTPEFLPPAEQLRLPASAS